MVKERKRVLSLVESGPDWQFLICRLAVLALSHLTDSGDNPASCLRFLEVYTGRSGYAADRAEAVLGRFYRHLVARDYYGAVRRLVDTRVPPLLGPALKPPTPLAGEILQMVSRPLHIAAQAQVNTVVYSLPCYIC